MWPPPTLHTRTTKPRTSMACSLDGPLWKKNKKAWKKACCLSKVSNSNSLSLYLRQTKRQLHLHTVPTIRAPAWTLFSYWSASCSFLLNPLQGCFKHKGGGGKEGSFMFTYGGLLHNRHAKTLTGSFWCSPRNTCNFYLGEFTVHARGVRRVSGFFKSVSELDQIDWYARKRKTILTLTYHNILILCTNDKFSCSTYGSTTQSTSFNDVPANLHCVNTKWVIWRRFLAYRPCHKPKYIYIFHKCTPPPSM